MYRRVAYPALAAVLLTGLNGCALNLFHFDRREAWRDDVEAACMAQRPFRHDDYIVEGRSIRDQGVCGMERPLTVAAMLDGSVRVGPAATVNCVETVALENWIAGAVQPAAIARFGSPVVGIRQMNAYSCRPVNNVAGNDLSEHAFGNALDIGGFELANGRVVTVLNGWNGAEDEQAFLREVHALACQYFNTVLGPGVELHDNHFHLDMAHHNADGTSHYCRPTPVMPPPARDPVYNMPMAFSAEAGGVETDDIIARLLATVADR